MKVNPKITGEHGLEDALAELNTHNARGLPGYPKVLTNADGRQLAVRSVSEEVQALGEGYREKEQE